MAKACERAPGAKKKLRTPAFASVANKCAEKTCAGELFVIARLVFFALLLFRFFNLGSGVLLIELAG